MARNSSAALAAKLESTDPELKAAHPSKKTPATKKVVPQSAVPDKEPQEVVLSKPIRLSVDIDPIPYRKLMSFCQDIAMVIGRARIQHVWVMRALVDELLESKELQRTVIDRVTEKHGPGSK